MNNTIIHNETTPISDEITPVSPHAIHPSFPLMAVDPSVYIIPRTSTAVGYAELPKLLDLPILWIAKMANPLLWFLRIMGSLLMLTLGHEFVVIFVVGCALGLVEGAIEGFTQRPNNKKKELLAESIVLGLLFVWGSIHEWNYLALAFVLFHMLVRATRLLSAK